MSSVMLSIGEFARLGGVSPRMLRHYDELGLFKPERVDPSTGYRAYEFAQLASLHRLVTLRDLGLSLQQIGEVLPEDPTVDRSAACCGSGEPSSNSSSPRMRLGSAVWRRISERWMEARLCRIWMW